MKRRIGILLWAAVLLVWSCAPAEIDAPAGAPEEEHAVHVADDVWRLGDWLYRVLDDGTAELTEFEGEDYSWEIPEEIAGHRVTAIGERCFSDQGNMHYYTDEYPDYHRANIRSVVIPEGVVRIGAYAFEGCFNLVEAVFPESLRVIGEGAFSGCGSLMKTELPEGLEELGDYAFAGCRSLIRLNIPRRIRTMGKNPFADCNHLAKLEIDPFNLYLRYEDGLLTDAEQNRLICCTKEAWGVELEVPEGIRIIGESALASAPFERILLPETLTGIESFAFSGCAALRELTIPEKVEFIGENPVRGCIALRELTVSEKQDVFSVRNDTLFDDREGRLIAYLRLPPPEEPTGTYGDLEETSGKFPEWKEIDGVRMRLVSSYDRPYYWDDSEEEEIPGETYAVPDGIRAIGSYAFSGADIGSVQFPKSVTAFGTGAFAGCRKLTECRLPEKIREIPDRLFEGCTGLRQMELPEGITFIGEYAFSNSGITEMVLPPALRSLGAYAFEKCKDLEIVLLYEGLERIPKGAFSRCDMLWEMEIPESVTVIETQAFAWDQNLQRVNLPSGLTMIPDYCFYDTHIKSTVIPDGVTYIGDHAYRTGEYNGSDLEAVYLPEGLEYIGNYAFSGGIFKEITVPGNIAAMGKYAFTACDLISVHLGEGLKRIEEGTFHYCWYLKSAEIPDSVRYIGDRAFSNCYALTFLEIPGDKVEYIGNPFGGSQALATLPEGFVPPADEEDPEEIPPEENLMNEVLDGNVYSKVERKLLLLNNNAPIRPGTRVIGRKALYDYAVLEGFSEPLVIPESVELIELDDEDFCYNHIPWVYVVPGSVAEAYFEHGYFD